MASPVPHTARRVAVDTSSTGPLTRDCLYEVLLRLRAKDLCCYRAVSRPWRDLLSDPHFIYAYGARRPREPLLLASYAEGAEHDALVDVLDVAGRVVKRVHREEGEVVVDMALDLVCVKKMEGGTFQLMNPATRATYQLPNKLPEEHLAPGFKTCHYGEPLHMFGKVASTGEYKVLRMFPYRLGGPDRKDLFEVCTVNSESPGQWRRKGRPSVPFVWNEFTRVVIGGVVYFLTVDAYVSALMRESTEESWIVLFDLEAEEWGSIKGPSGLVDDEGLNGYHAAPSKQLTLANLNDSLVIVHGPTPYMDLWFLTDSDKGLWIKNYSVQIEQYSHVLPVHPLILLDNERIVMKRLDLLQIHDSRANTFSNVLKLRHLSRICMFTGNLLSLDREN